MSPRLARSNNFSLSVNVRKHISEHRENKKFRRPDGRMTMMRPAREPGQICARTRESSSIRGHLVRAREPWRWQIARLNEHPKWGVHSTDLECLPLPSESTADGAAPLRQRNFSLLAALTFARLPPSREEHEDVDTTAFAGARTLRTNLPDEIVLSRLLARVVLYFYGIRNKIKKKIK